MFVCLLVLKDVAKNNIIWCIWCNAMCLCGLRLKNTLFSTYCTLLLLLYAPPFWNESIFTKLIVKLNITMSAFVIGETTNNKRYSTLLKTRVWIVSGKFFK